MGPISVTLEPDQHSTVVGCCKLVYGLLAFSSWRWPLHYQRLCLGFLLLFFLQHATLMPAMGVAIPSTFDLVITLSNAAAMGIMLACPADEGGEELAFGTDKQD